MKGKPLSLLANIKLTRKSLPRTDTLNLIHLMTSWPIKLDRSFLASLISLVLYLRVKLSRKHEKQPMYCPSVNNEVFFLILDTWPSGHRRRSSTRASTRKRPFLRVWAWVRSREGARTRSSTRPAGSAGPSSIRKCRELWSARSVPTPPRK